MLLTSPNHIHLQFLQSSCPESSCLPLFHRMRQRTRIVTGFESVELCNDHIDDIPMDVGEAVIAALEAEGEALVVDSEQVQHGRVQVMHVDAVLDDVVPE